MPQYIQHKIPHCTNHPASSVIQVQGTLLSHWPMLVQLIMKHMNKKQVLAAGGAAAVSLLIAIPAFAATTTPATNHTWGGVKPAVTGTVSAINGDTLTITSKNGTTYSIDATNATIQKGFGKSATTIAVSSIAVNDTVAVRGTVSGDDVTATSVVDGVRPHKTGANASGTASSTAMHQRLANASFGTVASVNGSSFTLSHKTKTGTSTVTITTTSSTTFKKNGQADTATDLTVGQRVVAMGTKDAEGNIADATSVNIFTQMPHAHRTATSTPAS
jgi:hypothetical protein